MIAILNILKSIPLFEGLEDSDLNRITAVVKERKLPKGATLFKEGDTGDSFFLLKEGAVEILKTEGGQQKTVTTIEHTDKNNFFGEMALIEGAPRNATIRTAKDCICLEIAKTDFDMLLRLNSFIALRIMTALSRRFRAGAPEKQVEAKLGKVVAVFSPKSGAGKSTFVANLASGLARKADAKVLVIDLDLQFGDLAFMLGLSPKRTIADLVDNPTDKFEVLKEYLVEHKSGFAVLPAPIKPEQSEMINSSHLRAVLDLCKKTFDYIILDTHSLFQDLTINAMDIADLVFLMMLPNMNHIKNMHVCLKVMENLKYAPEKIKLVLNREGSQFARSREEIEAGLKRKVEFSLRDNWKQVSEMLDHQKTIFDLGTPCEYQSCLEDIIQKITGKQIKKEDAGMMGKIKGWFS